MESLALQEPFSLTILIIEQNITDVSMRWWATTQNNINRYNRV